MKRKGDDIMNKSEIERQLTKHCHDAGLMTQKELAHFLRSDGKVSGKTVTKLLSGVPCVRLGHGGTKRYFVSEVAKRMHEFTE